MKNNSQVINQADKYLKQCQKQYGGRVNLNVKEFVRGFAYYLEKHTQQVATTISLSSQVALITENNSHLTGGRYYCYMLGCALVEAGFDIVLYTNEMPSFLDFFSSYTLPKLAIIEGHAERLERADIKADLYIGSPISGNLAAIRNAKKYGKPAFPMIFDPFPMMKEFLGKDNYPGWEKLIKEMRESDCSVLTLCNATHPYIHDWLNKKEEQLIPIYPCINSRVKDTIPQQQREDFALFISRIVPNKRFDHVLAACKANDIQLKVITSASGVDHQRMVRDAGMEKRVQFIFNASEQEKFRLIKQARVVINGAVFEGFGMWAAEAIDCGTPLVCYDNPTLKEIYRHSGADNVYFAEHGSIDSLTTTLAQAWSDQQYREPQQSFSFERMIERVTKIWRGEIKIGVITIALNEEQFIAASLRSVIRHKNIHKVAVIEGAVELFPVHKNFLSVDKTRDQVLKVMAGKHGEKILFERYGKAKDKSELRNRGLELLKSCDYILVLDADELYQQEDLDRLVEIVRENPTAQTVRYPFYHFWKNAKQITTGGQWDSLMPRFFKFQDKASRWVQHQEFPVDSNGVLLSKICEVTTDDIHCYHFGYCKDGRRIKEKIAYYKSRDTYLHVKDTFTNWQEGDPTSPTHRGGIVEPFTGKLPPEIDGLV